MLQGERENVVMKLQNNEGDWENWGDGLERLMEVYFKILFITYGCSTDPILRSIGR